MTEERFDTNALLVSLREELEIARSGKLGHRFDVESAMLNLAPLVRHLDQLYLERDHWRDAALWLADCHAATAEHDLALKSTSKFRRERLVSICVGAAGLLRRSWATVKRRPMPSERQHILERCECAVEPT